MHYQRWAKHGDPNTRILLRNADPVERFKTYFVEKAEDACWEWTGTLSKGYGRFWAGKATGHVPAHRFSYITFRGTIPDKMIVCHTCDNPRCVNPAHLWLGSHLDNALDKTIKNRNGALSGSRLPHAKLTEADVRAIRSDDRPLSTIASDYGVTYSNIHAIKTFRTWKHIVD